MGVVLQRALKVQKGCISRTCEIKGFNEREKLRRAGREAIRDDCETQGVESRMRG